MEDGMLQKYIAAEGGQAGLGPSPATRCTSYCDLAFGTGNCCCTLESSVMVTCDMTCFGHPDERELP